MSLKQKKPVLPAKGHECHAYFEPKRKPVHEDQSIKIKPGEKLPKETPVGTLFADGPIEVKVNRVQGNQVRLGVAAHPDLVVLRDELCEE